MSATKVKNGSSNGLGLTPGMTNKKNHMYTQGVNTNYYDELIHTSKKKITKINNFLDEYEGGAREIEPEVVYSPKRRGSRSRRGRSWRGFCRSRTQTPARAKCARATCTRAPSEKSPASFRTRPRPCTSRTSSLKPSTLTLSAAIIRIMLHEQRPSIL